MAKDRSNVRIYGDDAGAVFTGAKGVTGPTTLAAPDSDDFTEVGWLSEDGVDLDRDESVSDHYGWQGGALIRSKRSSVKDSFHFICLEETALTLGLYYAGATPTTAASVDTFAISNQSVSDERAWVVDFIDGDIHKRLVAPSGEITARATVPHKATDLTMYDFTVTIYGDYSILKTAE